MRRFVRFQNNPSSVRYAAAAIMSTTVILVLAGAFFMRVFDSEAYPTFGAAAWFTLQTITTVGYGDSTPDSTLGRVVASVVMLVSIALITVVTAAITSLLIRSVTQEQQDADRVTFNETLARIEVALAAAQERLDQITESTTTQRDDNDE